MVTTGFGVVVAEGLGVGACVASAPLSMLAMSFCAEFVLTASFARLTALAALAALRFATRANLRASLCSFIASRLEWMSLLPISNQVTRRPRRLLPWRRHAAHAQLQKSSFFEPRPSYFGEWGLRILRDTRTKIEM